MAKQAGIVKLKGTIGGVSFYKSQDGYLAREKGGVDKERIMSDPAFQRTRENGAEFGAAGKAVRQLKSAFKPIIRGAADNRVNSRLIQTMVKVLQADTTNDRGERTVVGGDLTLLKGFEFNKRSQLTDIFSVLYTHSVDRVTGELEVNIPAFVPINLIDAPEGTTHFSVEALAVEANFGNNTFTQDVQSTVIQPYDASATTSSALTCSLTPNSTDTLMLALGVKFYQEVNGTQYPLKNGSYNAVSMIAVSVV